MLPTISYWNNRRFFNKFLGDLEDFSYKEIADIVGCPLGTVMSRLYRGRRLLRKKLHDYAVNRGYLKDEEKWTVRN